MPQMLRSLTASQRKIAKNTTAQLIGRAVGAITTFIITLFVARWYGTVGYGDFVKITTFISFFYLLADFGFNAIYIQQSSQLSELYNGTPDQAFTVLGVTRIGISMLLLFTAILIASLLPEVGRDGYTKAVKNGIYLLAPTIFFQAMTTSANAFFQKILRYEYSTLAVVIGSAATVYMVWTQTHSSTADIFSTGITPLLIGSAVTSLVGGAYIFRTVSFGSIRMPMARYISFFYQTIPLGLTLIFNVIYFHIDSVILTVSRSTQEVGLYGLAYKVFELLLVFPTFFMNAVYPTLVQGEGVRGKGEGKLFVQLIVRLACFLLVVSCLVSLLAWYGAPLISLIKSDFTASVLPFRILILGLPFFFLSSLFMWVLIALKKQWTLVWIYGSVMAVTIIANIIFIPSGGFIAAAWITVASEGLVLIISGAVVFKELKSY